MPEQSLYRRLLWPVYVPATLFGVAAGATVPVQVVAAIQLGASPALAALIVAVVGGVGLLTTVWAGRLIDAVGDRRAMVAATIGAAVTQGAAIAALVWGGPGALALFIASMVLRAPAMNVWNLARQAYTAEHVSPAEVGRAMTGLGGTNRIGALVGPLLGGLLLLVLPLWSVYVLSVACALLALVVLHAPSLGGEAEAKMPASGTPRGDRSARRQPLAVDWTRVVLAGVAVVCLALARVGQPVVVQLWGLEAGLDTATIALLVAVGAAVEIACMFPGGHLKDRLGRAMILITCLLVYGLGFLLLVPLTLRAGVWGMAAAVVVMAIGNGLGAGVNMTIGADLSPAEGRARFLGVWALFSNAGALAGPTVISAIVGASTVPAAVTAVGAITVAGALWVAAVARRVALPGRAAGGH